MNIFQYLIKYKKFEYDAYIIEQSLLITALNGNNNKISYIICIIVLLNCKLKFSFLRKF